MSTRTPGSDRHPSSCTRVAEPRCTISGLIIAMGARAAPSSAISSTRSRLRHRDLNRGEPDPGRRVHRLQHIVDQPAHLGVDALERVRLCRNMGSGNVMIFSFDMPVR